MDWTPYLPKYIHTKGCIANDICPVDDCQDCDYQGKWRAGKWYKHDGELSMCNSGIHLTSEPFKWLKRNSRIFSVEHKGQVLSDNSDKCCFHEVRLTHECGYGHIVRQVSLWKALSSGANLTDADLRDADLTGADLRDADLTGAYLRGAYLTDADLRDADLRDADLRGAYLTDADLRDADLTGAYLTGAYLTDADLRDADLRDADLRGAYLTDADLRDADLRDADLRDADLRGAYLTDADLTGAYLRGAYLTDADLTGAWINVDPKIKGYNFKDGRLWNE